MANSKGTVFTSILSLLKIKHTRDYSNKFYNEHPHKYNMFGLSKMLSAYNIENIGLRIDNKEENIYELAPPFIAHVGSDFVVVNKITAAEVQCIWQKKHIEVPVEEFVKIWTGIILVAEPSKASIEPNYKKHRKTELSGILQKCSLLITVTLAIILAYVSNRLFTSIGLTLSILINLIGIYICFMLVQKQLNIQNEYVDKICSLFKKSDCNNVLESDAAKLWGVFGWSEIGLAYFSSNIIILLFFSQLIPFLVLISICTLPYSLWSIWYQKFKAKQWCPLCLVVQVLFWALFIVHLLFGYVEIPDFTISNLLLVGCIYATPFLIISLILPLLARGMKIEQITQEVNSIKATSEVFSTLLKKQTRYVVSKDTSDIIWGNTEAEILVTVLTNPHCNPCAKMHARIENVLKENIDKLCVQYIFSSFEESLDISNKFMIAVYLEKGREEALNVFRNWFERGSMNKEDFFSKYKVNIENESVEQQFEDHNQWREKTGLRATPTILINGYKLPDNYKIEDLKYFSTLDL